MKIKTIITITTITTLLPLIALAQLDLNLDNLFLNEEISPAITINKLDLIWSADTYTPYEYQGRALPVVGSEIEVAAIVNTSGGRAGDLKYSWFLEDVFQRSKSGYGKNRFSFYVLQHAGANHTVRVQVFNDDRSVFEEKTIQIPIVEPEIILQSSATSSNREFSFVAKPYFFSIKKLTDLSFEWYVPGQEAIISSDYDASVLNLNIGGKTDQSFLENDLRVSVSNIQDPRQEASQTIKFEIY